MINQGQTIDMLTVLPAMNMDPHDFFLTLKPDGTGYMRFGEDEASGEITWTDTQFTPKENADESANYTRSGDHIVLEVEGMTVEFAPEGEVEVLLAMSKAKTAAAVKDGKELVGEWKLSKAMAMGQVLPLEKIQEMNLEMSFCFNADGTATMTSKGETKKGIAWSFQESTVVLTMYGYELFKLKYDGQYLVLTMGADLYFEKVN